MSFVRRQLFSRVAAAVFGAAAGARAVPALAATDEPQKVVYHLADLDKVNFVLGNIRNHIDGMGGPDRVRIVLVVHGPALRQFRADAVPPDTLSRFTAIADAGVGFAACGNTLRAMDLDTKGLLSGFEVAEEGGVVRIARLQAEGYLYLRP